MALYKRDYTKLTDEELISWEAVKEQEKAGKGNLKKANLFRQYPKAARHYMSLFPNHYLDIEELQEFDRLEDLSDKFLNEIDNLGATEITIMKFIKQYQAYFIVGSLLNEYNFGHHEAYIIPEFLLGNTWRVDYLIIGKRSGGYEFIFVELEHPTKEITIKDGELGGAFRKGIKQINQWKRYLGSNFNTLEETFNKYKHPKIDLPREFMKQDLTRIHYAVIAGRRSDFDENTYWHKRKAMENEKINLLHFDNLYDLAKVVIGKPTY